MMDCHSYSLSTDFSSGLDIVQFHSEVDADPGISPVLDGITLNPNEDTDEVCVMFTAALSGAEKTTLDGLVASHVPA